MEGDFILMLANNRGWKIISGILAELPFDCLVSLRNVPEYAPIIQPYLQQRLDEVSQFAKGLDKRRFVRVCICPAGEDCPYKGSFLILSQFSGYLLTSHGALDKLRMGMLLPGKSNCLLYLSISKYQLFCYRAFVTFD